MEQETKLQPRTKKYLRYSLIGLGTCIGLIMLIAILVPLCFENQIKKVFIRELNENLATPVVVDQDDIDLTILRSFPNASVDFKNISIKESFQNSKKNFLHAGEISLQFNLIDIIKGHYIIKKIKINNASIKLITDKEGNINYKFWKESASTNDNDFSILLQEVTFENVNLDYTDFKNKQDLSFNIHEGNLKGNFSSKQYILSTTARALCNRIKIGDGNYLVNQEVAVDTDIDINVSTDTYSFKHGDVEIAGNTFLINGNIIDADVMAFDLMIKGDDVSMSGLTLLLPSAYSQYLKGIESKGKIAFDTSIKGKYGNKLYPAVLINFSLQNGSIYHEKFNDKLSSVSFTGVFFNGAGKPQESYLKVKDFKAIRENSPVSFSLMYNDFSNPYIDLNLDGNIPASIVLPFLFKNDIRNVEGYFTLKNVTVKGLIKNMSDNTLQQSATKGSVQFHDINFSSKNENFSVKNGEAELNSNEIVLNNLHAEAAGSDVRINVVLSNWVNSLFGNTANKTLNISGSIISNTIDVGRILHAFSNTPSKNKIEPATETTATHAQINISGNIALQFDQLLYNKFNIRNMKTDVRFSKDIIIAKEATGETMDGNFRLDASFRKMPSGNYILETAGLLNALDITQLFIQFNNFGQHSITSEYLKGTASAQIENITVGWDKNFNLNENSIYLLANMLIEKGELIEYKPLETLSKFVNINDLKDIKFSTLQNQIEIKNSVVYIPAMQIKSSALDLSMSGTHSFTNVIDYQFQLSLADLLVKKYLGGNKKKDEYEEGANGGINIFVSMTGSVNNPVIKYNKKEAKQKLKSSDIEHTKFIDIFKSDDTSTDTKWDRKNQEIDTSDTIEFIDFDDDGKK